MMQQLTLFSHIYSSRAVVKLFFFISDSTLLDIWCLWNFLIGVNISSNVSRQLALRAPRGCALDGAERAAFDHGEQRLVAHLFGALPEPADGPNSCHSESHRETSTLLCWIYIWSAHTGFSHKHMLAHAPVIHQWFSISTRLLYLEKVVYQDVYVCFGQDVDMFYKYANIYLW